MFLMDENTGRPAFGGRVRPVLLTACERSSLPVVSVYTSILS